MPKDAQGRRFRFGLYEVNESSGELRKNGDRLRLQEQPFQVLLMLLESPGEVISREELRERLWPADTFVDFDHSLNTAINKLREALGDTAGNPRFIETLPRRGYRFIAPVERLDEEPETPAKPDKVQTGAEGSAVRYPDLPAVDRKIPRTLFGVLQGMYLLFYGVALWRLSECGLRVYFRWNIRPGLTESVILVTAMVGICVRLYTLNATLFDYVHLGRKFQHLFWLALPLDLVWALSPFLITHLIGTGLAFACCVALVYSPFAQRVLALMAYPPRVA